MITTDEIGSLGPENFICENATRKKKILSAFNSFSKLPT
jgi:hypothetical protein